MKSFIAGTPNKINLPLDKDGLKFFDNLVKKFNGKKDLYRSLYNFEGEVADNHAIIDKIYFDFDPEKGENADKEKVMEYVRHFNEVLDEEDIARVNYFSGNGCHIFVFTEPVRAGNLKYAKGALHNVWNHYNDTYSLHADVRIRGDLVRIARLPNSINTRTGRFCIPLRPDEIYLSRAELLELAKNPRNLNDIYRTGNKLIDLNDYDKEIDYSLCQMVESDYNIDNLNGDIVLKQLPLCCSRLLLEGEAGYLGRYLIILAMREMIFSRYDAERIIRKYLTHIREDGKTEAEHCLGVEEQLDYLYDRKDLKFPKRRTIMEWGFCVKGCPGCPIYKG